MGASANETLLRVSFPRAFTGSTRRDRDRLCYRMREFGGDSLGSAALSHVRAGTCSMQEHAWLAHLTQELRRDSNSPNQERFGAGYIHIFKRVVGSCSPGAVRCSLSPLRLA